MVFKQFRVNCIVRIVLISGSIFGFFYVLFRTTLYGALFIIGMLILYQIYSLIHYVEKTNRDLRSEFELAHKEYVAKVQSIKVEFEKERQSKIQATAVLRINVDPRFQKVVDIFLKQLPESQD